jgi:hypothetical protein
MMWARPFASRGPRVDAAAVFTFGGTKLVMLEMLTPPSEARLGPHNRLRASQQVETPAPGQA